MFSRRDKTQVFFGKGRAFLYSLFGAVSRAESDSDINDLIGKEEPMSENRVNSDSVANDLQKLFNSKN